MGGLFAGANIDDALYKPLGPEFEGFLGGTPLRKPLVELRRTFCGPQGDDLIGRGVEDHQLQFKVAILASRESALLIGESLELRPYQEMVWGHPVPTKVGILPPRVETGSHHFEVIETPGHCPDHVSLVELTKGWCFTGGLFISSEPKALRSEEDTHEIARSMRKLVDLPAKKLTFFTGLGDVVEDGREALQSCIDYIHRLWNGPGHW